MSAHAAPAGAPARGDVFSCLGCGRPYPAEGLPYRCSHCGGLYDFNAPFTVEREQVSHSVREGMGRFGHIARLLGGAPLVSLGEGDTPLLAYDVGGRVVYFKAEHLNPTGSFKDRGAAVLVSWLAAMGVNEAVEDSSGNAGAAFAAYAARAGIRARVFVPDSASGPKRAQIESYGAELVRVLGPRSEASGAAERAAEGGAVYASHAYLPHGLAGMATVAFEVFEQLGRAPGAFLAPVGHGSLLLGAHRGFEALAAAGVIGALPQLVGVQARACAPIWAVSSGGASALGWMQEGATLAEGIRIFHPFRGDAVLAAVERTRGSMVAVEEEAILRGREALGRLGLFVEPTSSVVWPALLGVLDRLPDPVVVALTGSGYKDLHHLGLESGAREEAGASEGSPHFAALRRQGES